MRVLFTAQPGSGHWRPLAPLAKALLCVGHEIAFATAPIACADLARLGFLCFPVETDDWLMESQSTAASEAPAQAATVWVELFAGSRAMRSLPDLLALCRAWKPDLVVREATEFAGCVAAERIGIPHVVVQVGAWRPALHRLIGPALDRLRGVAGLPPDPSREMLHRHLLLSLTPPSFADPTSPLPPTAHPMRYLPFDGDLGGDVNMPAWAEAPTGRPMAYATLGTAYNRTPGLMQAILAALECEPVNLVLALGPGIDPEDLGQQPPHIHVTTHLPQSLIFPHCDLVVCHGGFGTMMSALSHGLPLVMLPIAADQPENAQRCADLGVASMVTTGEQTPEAIREATQQVLAEPRYQRVAGRLRDEMASMPDLGQITMLLERFVWKSQSPDAAPGEA